MAFRLMLCNNRVPASEETGTPVHSGGRHTFHNSVRTSAGSLQVYIALSIVQFISGDCLGPDMQLSAFRERKTRHYCVPITQQAMRNVEDCRIAFLDICILLTAYDSIHGSECKRPVNRALRIALRPAHGTAGETLNELHVHMQSGPQNFSCAGRISSSWVQSVGSCWASHRYVLPTASALEAC